MAGTSGMQQGQNGGPPWQNPSQQSPTPGGPQGVNPLALLFPRLAQMQQQQESQNYARGIDQYNLRRQYTADQDEMTGRKMFGQTALGLDAGEETPQSSMAGQQLPLPATMARSSGQSSLPTGAEGPAKQEPSGSLDLRHVVQLVKKQVPDIGKHPEQMQHILQGFLPFMKQEDKDRTTQLLEAGRLERAQMTDDRTREHNETMAQLKSLQQGETERHHEVGEGQADKRQDETTRHHQVGEGAASERIEIAKNRMAEQHQQFHERLQSQLEALNAKMAQAKSIAEKKDVQSQMRMAGQQAIAASNNAARLAASGMGGGTSAQGIQEEATKTQKLYGDMTKKYLTGGGGGTPQEGRSSSAQPITEAFPKEAVEMLKKDPSSAAHFDEIFGEGASKYVLGQ